MMNMTAKVAFELTKDGKVTIEVEGNGVAIKAALLSVIERMADIEEVSIAIAADLAKGASIPYRVYGYMVVLIGYGEMTKG